jgi:probable phosphomutase (TIGR03848 family)
VPTLLLVRHGLTALTGPILTGHTPGIGLDDRGRAQAAAVAERISSLPLTRVVSSPLERCMETAQTIVDVANAAMQKEPAAQKEHDERSVPIQIEQDERIIECRYGDWTGQSISELSTQPLWTTVQVQPSAVRFPGGESLPEVAARAVAAIRDINAQLDEAAIWVACSHGDVIKAILADALGMHLDSFQRIVVDPCSVSVVRYTADRPYVLRMNDTAGDLSVFAPVSAADGESEQATGATVGGGAGAGAV